MHELNKNNEDDDAGLLNCRFLNEGFYRSENTGYCSQKCNACFKGHCSLNTNATIFANLLPSSEHVD